MLLNRRRRRFTEEEYLLLEERSESKSEYYDGEIFAMTGASVEHNQLVRNLTLGIGPLLKGGPCQIFVADLRLHIAGFKLYTYPDLFVACGPLSRLAGRSDTLTDATLVIEVLSPSTKDYDRGQKFLFYQDLPSFQEYLLVTQDLRQVEHRRRQRPGQWLSTQMTDGTVELESIGVSLDICEIYQGVDFGEE